MTVCFFGFYDPTYPRNRVLLKGLRNAGVEVLECRTDRRGLAGLLALLRQHRHLEYDVLFVAYADSCLPVLLARCIAKGAVVWDAFYSRYDTLVHDRQLVSRWNPKALYHYLLEWLAARVVHLVLLDTATHARYFAELFRLSEERLAHVLVGTDEHLFAPKEARRENVAGVIAGIVTVGFYGKYIPLQGVDTIVRAVALLAEEQIEFSLVGDGQTHTAMRELARELRVGDELFSKRVPYEELPNLLSGFDIALGIFGTSRKAASVIPNKVYEAAATGKPIVTADTPAIRELFTDGEDILLVRPGDSEGLAAKIRILASDARLRRRIGAAAQQTFLQRATSGVIGKRLHRLLQSVYYPS